MAGFSAYADEVKAPGKTEKADFSDNFAGNAQNTRHISVRLHEVFVRASVCLPSRFVRRPK